MSFRSRVFIGIVSVSLMACTFVAMISYFAISSQQKRTYFARYQALAEIVAGTFQQLESISDQSSQSALAALDNIIEASGKLPSDRDLRSLATSMVVNAFYVVDQNGHFLRSSDFPVEKQTNSIFDYCDNYRGLLDGRSSIQQTPVIPGWPHDIPTKFTMVSNKSKTMILEAGVNLQYLSEVLDRALRNDQNVRSIGLYAPNGYELGAINAGGTFTQGHREASREELLVEGTFDDHHVFAVRVPTNNLDCCECKAKGVADKDGEYYETLKLSVTLAPLWAQWAYLRSVLYATLGITTALSLGVAALVSRGLVSQISKIGSPP